MSHRHRLAAPPMPPPTHAPAPQRNPAWPARFALAATITVSSAIGSASATTAAQEPIERISVAADGSQSSAISYAPSGRSLSADGRYALFISDASDLVAGDQNQVADLFLRDRLAATTVRVNVSSSGAEANGGTVSGALSPDGRFVVFDSFASNLVPEDTSTLADIFLHDRDPDGNGLFDEGNGTTERVSISSAELEANGPSWWASVSDDGNLVAVDANNADDIFVRNRASGTTTRASLDDANLGANDDCDQPQISGDGRYVVFMTVATNFGGKSGFTWDLFVRDRSAGTLRQVNVDAAGVPGDDQAFSPSLSRDGRFVAFITGARNLWPGDDSGTSNDIFVKDLVTGAVECASVDLGGSAGGGCADKPQLSADGHHVFFASGADDLVAHDLNREVDLFARDLAAGTTRAVAIDCTGAPIGAANVIGGASADGRFATFSSRSGEFVADDTNDLLDAFLHDLANPGVQAERNSYGSGWPGTHGIPALTADRDPEFGATVTVVGSNSWGFFTAGFLLIGSGRADVPTNRDGALLVDFFLFLPVVVPPTGFSDCAEIPWDPALCNSVITLQLLQIDPGASRGIAFSPGLELRIGR